MHSLRTMCARSLLPTVPACMDFRMTSDGIIAIDHVSLPMQHTDAMIAFYGALGFDIEEQKAIVSVHAGAQMIYFHRPELWPQE